MKFAPFLLFLFLLVGCQSKLIDTKTPVQESTQSIETKVKTEVDIDFLLYLPENYDTKKEWPLMLFLHGAGERGSELEKVAVHGPPKLAKQGKLQEFIIIAPQCPTGDFWDSHKQQTNLIELLNIAKKDLKVDENRVYVTGLSMGGFGTWQLASTLKNEIAAVAPICGGGNIWNARNLVDMPVWAFHGAKDDVVPPELSIEMVNAINNRGGNAKLTLYPNANHNSWDEAYDTESLYTWLLNQSLNKR